MYTNLKTHKKQYKQKRKLIKKKKKASWKTQEENEFT